ncbi:hypothetical protein J5N97_026975 [Dioscorea zingiberensis]|uniref:Magnesium transporter n=1 Tax=Dioscorea zingiberensis TaxID=325984 RepID=A0A9D5H7C1_9LILI|nr:hypothetical protein J5N97_026975 [Dioscorea zingiberensis]
MAKRTSKKSSSLPLEKVSDAKEDADTSSSLLLPPAAPVRDGVDRVGDAASASGCKKKGSSRLWMRFLKDGNSRDKAIIINLEFIKAIVTAEEVLILDPLCQEVLPFVEQLKWALCKSQARIDDHSPVEVLEIAMEVVCTFLNSNVADLERDAYPLLNELVTNVSRKNLEHVRNLKSKVTRLLARVQKVRDEIDHLLDDDENMAQLYLTRKQHLNQQYETLASAGASNSIIVFVGSNIHQSESNISSMHTYEINVEDLEMLLEAYFVSLDGTRNKILRVREYIDDTEDYVYIQLDNQRNELIQLQVILGIVMFSIAVDTMLAGAFAMNIPCSLYDIPHIFTSFVISITVASFLLGLLVLGYAKSRKLLGS